MRRRKEEGPSLAHAGPGQEGQEGRGGGEVRSTVSHILALHNLCTEELKNGDKLFK